MLLACLLGLPVHLPLAHAQCIAENRQELGVELDIVRGALQATPEIPDVADAAGSSWQPLIITGHAACGKNNIAKQYARHLATDFLEGRGQLVSLLVVATELAATISESKLCAADDLLGEHIRRTEADKALVDFLLARHAQRKLVVILDGVGEAGDVHAVLEPYITKRLAGEVVMCATGRENEIESVVISTGLAHLVKHSANIGLSGEGRAEVGQPTVRAEPSPEPLRMHPPFGGLGRREVGASGRRGVGGRGAARLKEGGLVGVSPW